MSIPSPPCLRPVAQAENTVGAQQTVHVQDERQEAVATGGKQLLVALFFGLPEGLQQEVRIVGECLAGDVAQVVAVVRLAVRMVGHHGLGIEQGHIGSDELLQLVFVEDVRAAPGAHAPHIERRACTHDCLMRTLQGGGVVERGFQ